MLHKLWMIGSNTEKLRLTLETITKCSQLSNKICSSKLWAGTTQIVEAEVAQELNIRIFKSSWTSNLKLRKKKKRKRKFCSSNNRNKKRWRRQRKLRELLHVNKLAAWKLWASQGL